MALTKKQTSMLIAAAIVVAGIAVYFLWIRQPAVPNVSVAGSGVTSAAQATFLALAAQLQPVTFDASILSDPRFMALIDIKTMIVPEDAGRQDPFAPLSGVVESE